MIGANKHIGMRVAIWALAALALFGGTPALAQSASCNELNRTLRGLDGNRDSRNLQSNVQQARSLAEEIRNAESRFVRGGCQELVNSSQRLTGECRDQARIILRGRDTYNDLS